MFMQYMVPNYTYYRVDLTYNNNYHLLCWLTWCLPSHDYRESIFVLSFQHSRSYVVMQINDDNNVQHFVSAITNMPLNTM